MGRASKKILIMIVFLSFLPFIFNPAEAFSFCQQEKPAYNLTVRAITLAVTVQDSRGRYVNDLEARDFIIYEDKEKMPMTYFAHDQNAPLSLTVLLDVSGSMALENKFEECRQALHFLAEKLLSPQDEISLLVFADGQVEVAAHHSRDKSIFLAALDSEEPLGMTALYDAVAASPEFAVRAKNEKRALLLVTDGIENDSQLTADLALEIARRVEIPIYVIAYKIPRSEALLLKHKRAEGLTAAGIIRTLNSFALATGGRAFSLDNLAGLILAMSEIKKELSHQYLLGYTSYKTESNFKQIKVVTVRGKYRVRTRQGY